MLGTRSGSSLKEELLGGQEEVWVRCPSRALVRLGKSVAIRLKQRNTCQMFMLPKRFTPMGSAWELPTMIYIAGGMGM